MAKAAEGLSPRTTEWYAMILARTTRALGPTRAVDGLTGPELRAYLLELRSTLAPVSVAGYVRTLKAFGNWLAAEELSPATALRALRKPRVPEKIVEPIGDDAMRRLLAAAGVRDRAILLLLLDTGLRVSEAAGIRLGDLRPDGTLKVLGKGSRERIVPVGGTARKAIVRYIAVRGAGSPDAPLFLGRRGGLDARGIQQAVRRLKIKVGLPGRCSPHSLRHTFARSFLVNGGDPLQPPAHPWTYDARHGEALRDARRCRPRGQACDGVPRRSARWGEGAVTEGRLPGPTKCGVL